MATVHRFEELTAFKKARELNRRVYRVTRDGPLAKDYGLCDQLRRSSVSVMSNIAEGFERGGRKEFIQFLSTAKGSAGELRGQLIAAYDAPFLDQATFDELYALAEEVGRVIAGLMKYLQSSDIAGPKYLGSGR
ncbi:MAG: four helix bundle protein [Gemmataceae bacterium]|nr:four helix bundle protein [Gemmataceae bacterium]